MSKAVHEKGTQTLTVSSDQVLTQKIDITSCNGVSFQLNGISGTAGSAKLQHSLDGSNWEDITSATSTLAASEANIINVSGLYSAHVRALVTLSGGAGSYSYFFLAKER
jgi:hypothetical protein